MSTKESLAQEYAKLVVDQVDYDIYKEWINMEEEGECMFAGLEDLIIALLNEFEAGL